ncbi:MAG: hypothetical protein ACKOW3_01090 [Hyphomicrobium sp.]
MKLNLRIWIVFGIFLNILNTPVSAGCISCEYVPEVAKGDPPSFSPKKTYSRPPVQKPSEKKLPSSEKKLNSQSDTTAVKEKITEPKTVTAESSQVSGTEKTKSAQEADTNTNEANPKSQMSISPLEQETCKKYSPVVGQMITASCD